MVVTKNTKPVEGTEIEKTGAVLNVTNRLYIDTTGGTDLKDMTTGKWAWVALDVTQITPSANETAQQDADYAGNGFGSTEVTSKRYQLALTGKRHIGDKAQDYIASKQYAIGNSLHTRVIWRTGDGDVMAEVTMSNIVATGGNANANQTFSCTLVFDGAPVQPDGTLTMTEGDDGTFTAAVAPTAVADLSSK